ncbi:hypothetical protein OQA88_5257 [Cercophora sp. LCS_1]
MELIWALAVLLILPPTLYVYTATVVSRRFPMLYNKRICLLIAHPDDEAMFFSPTVLALTRPEAGNRVKILCLSSGDAVGLGETRKRELAKSGVVLGLKEEDDVFVLESPHFPDSMTKTWDADKISGVLSEAFARQLVESNKTQKAAKVSVDVLITFDDKGVSSHPNHISLYHGARAFIRKLKEGGLGAPVDLYTLTTVGLVRKYAGILDLVQTVTSWGWNTDLKDKKHPAGLLFVNQLQGRTSVMRAREAMIKAHKSQMVWFRYGWITLSRYMYMNDLKLEKVED